MQKYLWKKSGLVVIGMLYLFLAWKGKRMIMVSGQELVEEPQEARKVALTFDDGPSEYTVELSRGLKERRVRATFFLLGERCRRKRGARHTYSLHTAGVRRKGLWQTVCGIFRKAGQRTGMQSRAS